MMPYRTVMFFAPSEPEVANAILGLLALASPRRVLETLDIFFRSRFGRREDPCHVVLPLAL